MPKTKKKDLSLRELEAAEFPIKSLELNLTKNQWGFLKGAVIKSSNLFLRGTFTG